MQARSKIAFICSSASWGGLEINVIRLATWLIRRGFDITLYTISGSKLQQQAIANSIQIKVMIKNKKYLDFRAAFRLSKLFRLDNITAAFVFHNRDMDLLAITKLISKAKFLLIYQQHMQIGVDKRGFLHTFRYSFYDAWITPLQCLADEVKSKTRFNPSRIHIIPLGIETGQFSTITLSKAEARRKLNIRSEGILFGIIGRIDRQKGQDFVIKAIKHLKTQHQAIELLIVGDTTHGVGSEYEQSLRQQTKEYGMEDHVHFRPFMEETQVFYNAIDIFVLATTGETYGMVTIEAMVSGKVIMATNSGGTPEICGNGKFGTLFEAENLHDFTIKANYVLEHPNEVGQKAQAAKSKAMHHYSCEHECDLIIDLLKDLQY